MVFIGTITIEWNGQRQPLKTMVFRWFWVSQPLVTMVFRWLTTIGPTMEWLHTIVEVYNTHTVCGRKGLNTHSMLILQQVWQISTGHIFNEYVMNDIYVIYVIYVHICNECTYMYIYGSKKNRTFRPHIFCNSTKIENNLCVFEPLRPHSVCVFKHFLNKKP